MGMGPRQPRPKAGVHDQAWHYLLGLGPDLALVQEALPPAWVRGEGTVVHGPFKQWGSVIFSPRYPLDRFILPEKSNLHSLGTYLAFAMTSLPDGSDTFVASVHARHAPARKAHLGELQPTQVKRSSLPHPMVNDLVFHGLDKLTQQHPSLIVGGDWNTGRTQQDETAGHEFFSRARDSGWYDCAFDALGEEVQTGYGRLLKQNDHVFCDSALADRFRSVRVASEAATDLSLSDHAPLVLDFDVKSIAMTNLGAGE